MVWFLSGCPRVFAPGNRDLHVHLSRTFGGNADPETLLAVLSGRAG